MTQIRTTLIEHLAPTFLKSFNLHLSKQAGQKSLKMQDADSGFKKKSGLAAPATIADPGAPMSAWGASDTFNKDADEFGS